MKAGNIILAELLEFTKENINSFSKIIGLKNSQNLYDIEKGKVKKISYELSEKIIKAYPNINREWLLTGDGEMLKEKEQTYTEKRRNLKNTAEPKSIPVFESAPVTLTTLELYRDEKAIPDFFIHFAESIPQLRGCDYATRATGDSMHPFIRGGSINFGRQIHGSDGIILGEVYIVHTKKGQETIKYVQQHPDKDDWFLLIPHNQVAKSTPIQKSDIIRIFEWRGALMFP